MATARKTKAVVQEVTGVGADFVFMDKSLSILDIGLKTGKNIVLYGPGGHGKSELTMAYLAEKGIDPYVITMGTGMTTDRLFGGLDIPTFEKTGKIEYLVENSFMNFYSDPYAKEQNFPVFKLVEKHIGQRNGEKVVCVTLTK